MLARDRLQLRRHQLLAARAAAMRAAPTASEAALWRALRARQLGVEVRRLVVIGDFIAGFVVSAGWLVLVVFGPCHAVRAAADARRDRELGRRGWRVLRLTAELVERELGEAVARGRAALGG